MNGGKKEYTLLWIIENYSYCWQKKTEKLTSPEFNPEGLDGTSWVLRVYPRGHTEKCSGNIFLFLARSGQDAGPETFQLKYEISIIKEDGSLFCMGKDEYMFKVGDGRGFESGLNVGDILLRRKSEFLQQDTLKVRFKILKVGGDIMKEGLYSARTRIGIEKISFIHRIENFSVLKPDEKKTLQIRSGSKSRCVVSSNLYFSAGEGKVIVEIVPSNSDYFLSKQKLSLLDGSGNAIGCSEEDYRFDTVRKDIKPLPLSLSRQIIMNRKSEYLPNDQLSLICECTFSTGVELEKIEETLHDVPMSALKYDFKNKRNAIGYNVAEKLSVCNSVSEDMKTIFITQCLTDVELKTKTKAFSAHKIVLCARSSVFKAMLTSDMQEKITDCIQVDDLEDDTVQQLLFFLYSDHLENLQWESAIKLYYAADKYAVEKLKLLCSSFLVDNLSKSTAGELLLLADTHNDSDLKKFVEDFILEYEDDVFGSDEWEKLIETNPQLVIKTMHLKYKRKKEGK